MTSLQTRQTGIVGCHQNESWQNGGWCIPTSNFTTSPGTNYLRALTCRPVVWGSVTLVILQSSCIINVIMLWPHKQLDNSMVSFRHKPTWVLHFSNYIIYVVPFPGTWPCTFLCTHFSSPALHQKLCFAYLEECPGLTFNYHIDWRPNNRGVQTVSHGADMVNHSIVNCVAETKPEADAFARARYAADAASIARGHPTALLRPRECATPCPWGVPVRSPTLSVSPSQGNLVHSLY